MYSVFLGLTWDLSGFCVVFPGLILALLGVHLLQSDFGHF